MADLLDYFERNIPKLHISPKLVKVFFILINYIIIIIILVHFL